MKDYDYPIFFIDNTCVHCGAKDSINPINKFGYPVKSNPIYPISHLKCKKCGREYFIRWEEDEKFEQPIAISKNYIDLFAKVVGANIDKYKKNN